jgi:hypothetical protein
MTSPYDTGGQSSDTFARLQRQLAARNAQPAVPSVEDQLNELEEELERIATDTAVAAVPVHDNSVLSRDAPQATLGFLPGLSHGKILLDYVWWKEEHFNQVCHWISAHAAAAKSGLPYKFFDDAILDMYNFDRALRATETHGLGQVPLRYYQIQQPIERDYRKHVLHRMDFDWSPTVPSRVTNAVSTFLIKTPPDALWIAVYVEKSTYKNDDPIIYAEFSVRNQACLNHGMSRWHVGTERGYSPLSYKFFINLLLQ